MTEPVTTPEVNATDGLLGWMLQYMRPYRRRVALLALLLVSEIGLGALQPWPMAAGMAQGTDPRTPQNRTFTWRPRSFFLRVDSTRSSGSEPPLTDADYPIG